MDETSKKSNLIEYEILKKYRDLDTKHRKSLCLQQKTKRD